MKLRKPNPSMIVALLALFVALSGTAIAGGVLISGTQIKAHTIAANKLTPNAVKFLHGARGAQGAQGPQGVDGATGATGPAGLNGGFDPNKVTQVVSPDASYSGVGTATAYCPAGTVVIGGGGYTNGTGLWDSRPVGTGGWFAGGESYNGLSAVVRAYAICAAP